MNNPESEWEDEKSFADEIMALLSSTNDPEEGAWHLVDRLEWRLRSDPELRPLLSPHWP